MYTVNDSYLAKYAVFDEENPINLYSHDEITSNGFLLIDLQADYEIFEICLCNSQNSNHLRNFKVYASNSMIEVENKNLCFHFTDEVSQLTLLEDSSYICKMCNCLGQFVRLQKTEHSYMTITDIKIRGNLSKETDDQLIPLESTELFYANESRLNSLSTLCDRLFSTYVEFSKPYESKYFLQINLRKVLQIKRVILDLPKKQGSSFRYIRVDTLLLRKSHRGGEGTTYSGISTRPYKKHLWRAGKKEDVIFPNNLQDDVLLPNELDLNLTDGDRIYIYLKPTLLTVICLMYFSLERVEYKIIATDITQGTEQINVTVTVYGVYMFRIITSFLSYSILDCCEIHDNN
ncbi:DgyrCDS14523 [Dimorphilus gyrociliatus]|uniref:DgyrCDS14523 n=1 Tax=Dimorphilus gyrociliatus TaxID=2664684 RepID=A0A7I8WE28_9ANNE|nr:DgyrCDS14523 [Dimorphilus gyrociliatus]